MPDAAFHEKDEMSALSYEQLFKTILTHSFLRIKGWEGQSQVFEYELVTFISTGKYL